MASGIIHPKKPISGKISSGGGTFDHSRLTNRDLEKQHPISAITNLQDELDSKLDSETALPLIEEAVKYKAKGLYYDANKELSTKSYWYLTSEIDETTQQGTKESVISGPYDLGSGGGGGGVTTVTVKQVNWPSVVVVGGTTKLVINWTSIKDEQATGNGTIYLSINDTQVRVYSNQPQGDITLDVSSYISSGDNTIQVKVIDTYGTSGVTVGSVSAITLELRSNFNYKQAFPLSGTTGINYTYIPYGDIEKTVYFIVDGAQYGTQVVKSTAEQQTFSIGALTHGEHSLQVYFTAVVDGSTVTSNVLRYSLIYHISGNTTPIIASSFDELEQEQYIPFDITYRVYIENRNTFNVDLLVDGSVYKQLSVNADEQIWEYTGNVAGNFTLGIRCGITTKSFAVHIAASTIDVKPVTQNLALALTTQGRSNSESEEERSKWIDSVSGDSCTLTDFNWKSDGWLKDSDGNTVLRVTGDARVSIPYKPFFADCKATGKTIELEIATSSVSDYSTEIIKCFSEKDNRGIYVTPQIALIKSLQSQISTQYKEDEHVRISFVIEKNTDNRIIWMYINGIASGACRYSTEDEFIQTFDPQEITIGSNDATVDIYTIRVYDNNLTSRQVVNNWIADTQISSLKATRYNRNNNYNDKDQLVISKLPSELPYMIWDINPLPEYKGDKRLGNVRYVEPLNTSRNFTSTDATYNVQGTSSAGYPVKNIRIKYKTNKDYPESSFSWYDDNGDTIKKFTITDGGIGDNYFTYKVDFASSEGANNVELTKLYNNASKSYGILNPPQKVNSKIRVGIDGYPIVAFHKDTDGNDVFCSKANFNNDKANEDVYGFADGDESWEITNNTSDIAKFKTAVTAENFSEAFEIRFPDEDGYSDLTKLQPMTQWVSSTYTATKTDEVLPTVSQLSAEPSDWSEHYYCYFYKDSSGNYLNVQSTSEGACPDFELNKYYSGTTYHYTNVVRSEDGSYSNRDVYVGFAYDSEAYRLSKFKAELSNWFNVDSTVFYYLYTHLFLMVDSRAKNAFPTYFASRFEGDGGDRWFWLPYDMDTAIGINNEGKLEFDYNLEDTDKVDGADVFNGQDSVMWNNVRAMFDGEIGQMYSTLRTQGLISYDVVESAFEAHQGQWSENIFNEDSKVKYIDTLTANDNYLEMLLGSKEQQRKWWLYNRFKYIDSKYTAADTKKDFIQFRAYVAAGKEKPDITITPYASIYATVSFANGVLEQERAKTPGEAVVIKNPFSKEAAETDQETYIYSASQLKSIGDISPFYPATLKVASAVKLQDLKVGDASDDYDNPYLTELTLGSNTLLKTLDVRNCSNLGSGSQEGATRTVDVSGCTNIEEIYFTGTKITGITLPDGGILKKLYLPNTLTALTIKNQPLLTDLQFDIDSDIFTKLWIENIPATNVDFFSIVEKMTDGAGVRIIGINETVNTLEQVQTFYDKLDKMRGLDSQGSIMPDVGTAQITGAIKINSTITYSDYVDLTERYPEVTITANIITCSVNFWKYKDISGSDEFELLSTVIVNQGSKLSYIPESPARVPSVSTSYTFNNWYVYNGTQKQEFKPSEEIIETDLNVYPEYTESVRLYTVTFDLQTDIPEITVEPSEEIIPYLGTVLRPTVSGIPSGIELKDWHSSGSDIPWRFSDEENPNTVSSDVKLIAHWNDQTGPVITFEQLTCNKYRATCVDDVSITGYAITHSEDVPEESQWIEVTPPSKVFTTEQYITTPETYYFWARDGFSTFSRTAYGKISGVEIKRELGVGVDSIDVLYKNSEGEYEVVDTSSVFKDSVIKISGTLDQHYQDLVLVMNEQIVDTSKEYTISSDVKISATCTPKTYTVDFYTFSKGTVPETQYIVYNNKVEKPDPQYDIGYVLNSWYYTEELKIGSEWDFENDLVQDNMTLYGKWEEVGKDPTNVFVTVPQSNYTVTVNYVQSAYGGVKVSWGDGNESSNTSTAGLNNIITFTHTYDTYGDYTIGFTCNVGIYRLGYNIESLAVIPSSIITGIDFYWDVPYTNPYAFMNATKLQAINLTKYMSSVADGCFMGCTSVKAISIPDSIYSIGSSAFYGCSGISGAVKLSDKVQSIGNGAFRGCSKITSIDVPDTVSSIGDYAFYGCSKLTEFHIPSSITVLREGVLSACTSITSLDVTENVTQLQASCFSACESLESVVLRNKNLTVVDGLCFNECSKLTSAGPIGSGCAIEFAWDTQIPDHAFEYGWGQSNLIKVVLPDTIKSIGYRTFYQCTVLEDINADEDLMSYLPESLLTVGSEAFGQCTNIKRLNIPVSVQNVGSCAFRNCIGLLIVNMHFTSVSAASKPASTTNSWFYYSDHANLIIHIPEILSDEARVENAYGKYWNYYSDTIKITYSADLQ